MTNHSTRYGSAHVAPTATRFVLYGRKSNEREDRQMRSLGDQEKLAREDAARLGLDVAFCIIEAKSAKNTGAREGFARMVRLIEDGMADGILCWHPDRLARNAVDGGWIIDLLDRGKLRDMRFLSYTFDNTPEGKFALGMVFSQAKYYVDKLSGEVQRGMREMRQEGGFPHYVPEGYKNARDDSGRKTVVPDPDRFPLLRRAFELVLSETYPPAEVRRLLNAWGYQTRTTHKRPGGPVSESGFYRMLGNPFYAGRCKDGDDWYKGRHEPLLTEAEFDRLQRIVGRSSNLIYRKHRFTYARGLFTCGNCGCQITATFAKGRHGRGSWTYYHCTNRRGGCSRQGTREEIVEAAVTGILARIAVPPELEPTISKMAETELRTLWRGEVNVSENAAARLQAARSERDRLLPLLLKGVLGEDEYREGRVRLDTEVESLEQESARSAGQLEAQIQSVQNAVSFAVGAGRVFVEGEPEMKRRVIELLTTNRVLTPGNPLLKPNPVLMPFLDFAAGVNEFKPSKTGSRSKKESPRDRELSFGRPNKNRIKLVELDANESPFIEVLRELTHALADAVRQADGLFPRLIPGGPKKGRDGKSHAVG